MKIKYICTYWGLGYLPVDKFIAKALKAGFNGVEVNVPFDKKFASSLQKAVKKTGIKNHQNPYEATRLIAILPMTE